MAALRIGINALYLLPGGVGGTEIYLKSLLHALAAIDSENQYIVFVNCETGDDLHSHAPGFHFVQCGVKARFRPARILYEQFALPGVLERHNIDVLFNPGFTMPAFARCPSVTVFHDLQHKRLPHLFRGIDLVFWKFFLWLSAVRSRSLIAVSPSTAEDLEKFLPVSAGKIRIVPHGVDPVMFSIKRLNSNSQPYILSVSTLHPHKNLDRLLDAFLQFHRIHPEYRMKIVGMKGFAADRLIRHCESRGLVDWVEFTGWVSRQELYRLYEGADAFIYPSLFEGFGMPVIEALAAGIPTACSAIAPLDWVGGDAVEGFNPLDTAAICNALQRITGDADFRSRSSWAGPAQAKRFDWNQSAAATLEELERSAK